MKNRDYKVLVPNGCYHLFNRGVGKMEIFRDQQDYNFFLSRLRENLFPGSENIPFWKTRRSGSRECYVRKVLPAGSFCLLSYCLMPNHFHFLIKQAGELSLDVLIRKVCTSYAMYFNKKYKRVGAVFQDQYKAVKVESDEQLLWVSAYMHQNPAVAGLTANLKDYPWSSHLDYIGIKEETLCDQSMILEMAGGRSEYEKFVDSSYEKIKAKKDIEHLLLDP